MLASSRRPRAPSYCSGETLVMCTVSKTCGVDLGDFVPPWPCPARLTVKSSIGMSGGIEDMSVADWQFCQSLTGSASGGEWQFCQSLTGSASGSAFCQSLTGSFQMSCWGHARFVTHRIPAIGCVYAVGLDAVCGLLKEGVNKSICYRPSPTIVARNRCCKEFCCKESLQGMLLQGS